MERNVFTPEQETWLKALESGEYSQTTYELENADGFCCLGVAVCLGVADGDSVGVELDLTIDNKLRLRGEAGQFHTNTGFISLTHMNDAGQTFAQIAAFIRANPWQVFTNFDVPEGK